MQLVKQEGISLTQKKKQHLFSLQFQSLFHLPLAELHEPTEAGTDSPRYGSYFHQFGGNNTNAGLNICSFHGSLVFLLLKRRLSDCTLDSCVPSNKLSPSSAAELEWV